MGHNADARQRPPRDPEPVALERLPLEDTMQTQARQPRTDRLVDDAMHRGVITCEREAPLSEVAATMARELVHCVVVESGSGEGGPPWGIISDLDLVAAVAVRDLNGQSAGGSAATPVITVSPTETLERAAQLMTEHNTAHLIVVDPAQQRPLGVLSTLDIAASFAEESAR
jgi:CBS domain-containing protein